MEPVNRSPFFKIIWSAIAGTTNSKRRPNTNCLRTALLLNVLNGYQLNKLEKRMPANCPRLGCENLAGICHPQGPECQNITIGIERRWSQRSWDFRGNTNNF